MTKNSNKSRDSGKSKSAVSPKAEEFINNASDLLEAFPSASVSIAYTKKDGQEDTGVKFTVNHSGQSRNLIYISHDSKEVSRILAFIGPGGITADKAPTEQRNVDRVEAGELEETTQRKPERITGLTSIMANHSIQS